MQQKSYYLSKTTPIDDIKTKTARSDDVRNTGSVEKNGKDVARDKRTQTVLNAIYNERAYI